MGVSLNDVFDAGNDILRSVTGAVETGNFSNLNLEIKRTMDDLGERMRTDRPTVTVDAESYRELDREENPYVKTYYKKDERYREVPPKNTGQTSPTAQTYARTKPAQTAADMARAAAGTAAGMAGAAAGTAANAARNAARKVKSFTAKQTTPFLQKTVGRAGSLLAIIFGAIGLASFGLSAIITLIVSVYLGVTNLDAYMAGGLLATAILGVFAGGSALLLAGGIGGKRLIDRYYEYGRLIGEKEFYRLELLALESGQKLSKVKENLHKMMRKGMLPQARFDAQETTLMLTDNAFRQYRDAEESRLMREEEEARKTRETEQVKQTAGGDEEVSRILMEGQEYLNIVRDCNAKIPDAEMTAKLSSLENIMYRIFERVKANPSSAKKVRRLMEYYLPATKKLLYAYIDLDRQPEVGDNIRKTKREIEDTLGTINDGFEKLLDSMFEDMAWDVSSDISVMKNLMQQDGLMEGNNTLHAENWEA